MKTKTTFEVFYFTCNESKIYESLTFLNKLQEKMNFYHNILFFGDVPVGTYCCVFITFLKYPGDRH